MTKEDQLKQLKAIPGVGKSIAMDLWNINIRSIDDLVGQIPEKLYERSNNHAGMVQDRCLLYVFRCAVYYAETAENRRETEKLKWWNWKDQRQSAVGGRSY
jgi:RecG-like helicase